LNKVENPFQLSQYDVIAFRNDEEINVIHRIVEVTMGEDGKWRYLTRGDSNNSNDKYKPCFEDIIRVYSGKRIPGIGVFVMFFQSTPGILTVVAMVYVLVMMDRMNNKMQAAQESRIKHLSLLIDQVSIDEVKDMKAIYKETIYYKGFAYHFTDSGFVSKEEITDLEVLQQSDDTVIKVKENEDSTIEVSKTLVDKKDKGE
jgi:hypothetical protein